MKKLFIPLLIGSSIFMTGMGGVLHDNNGHQDNYKLSSKINYQQSKFQKKPIFSSKDFEIILFAFTKDQKLKEHTVPFNAYMEVLEGEGYLVIGEKKILLKAGDGIKLQKGVAHAVVAKTDFKMLLTKPPGSLMKHKKKK